MIVGGDSDESDVFEDFVETFRRFPKEDTGWVEADRLIEELETCFLPRSLEVREALVTILRPASIIYPEKGTRILEKKN